MKRTIIIGALLLILGFVMGILCRPKHFREVTKMLTDTLVVTDTHIIEKPVLVERTIKDSLLVAVHDTLRIRDTLYITLPRETKVYAEEEYYAEVSGYKPSLDYIEVYPKTKVISKTETTTLKPSPWRYSLHIGADYERMGHVIISPNIGAEIGYKKISFGVEGGVSIGIENSVIQQPCLYWKMGMKYNLLGR